MARAAFRSRSGKVDRNTTVFLHIPRTGATVAADQVQRLLRPARVATINHSRELAGLRDDELSGFNFILARTNAMVLRRMPEAVKLTVMRDPMDRVLATYVFYRNTRKPSQLATLARGMSLAEFVASEHRAVIAAIDNAQARRLAIFEPALLRGEPRQPRSGKILLDQARKALDLFDAIGRFEDFDGFFARLGKLYGWTGDRSAPEEVRHGHMPVDPADIADDVRRAIRNRTGLDQALYEEVRSRFG